MAGPALAGVAVLVLRSTGQAEGLSDRLRALGAEAVQAPTIAIESPERPAALTAALAAGYDWVAFTSPNAVDAVWAAGGPPAGAQLASVGPGSTRALRRHGRRPDLVAEPSTARGLADALRAGGPPAGILLPRADIAGPTLPRLLRAAGWQVREIEAYRTVPASHLPEGVAERLREGRIDVVAATSGSTVRALLALLGGRPHERVRLASIGPSTTAACEHLGWPVDVEAEAHDLDGLVRAVVAAAAA